MRRSSALLLALVALAGCAAQGRPGEPSPTRQSIVAIEVTNPYDRSIDVFYSTQFLGTLSGRAHASYPVAPSTVRAPIYARWTGQETQRFNLSTSPAVRYVYEDAVHVSSGARRCIETVC